MMEKFMVDGIIISICSYKKNMEEYSRLQASGMPLVFYDRIPYGMNVSQVIVDDYMKSFFLVESLIRSGYKRIAHIKGNDDIYNSIERYNGYKDALAKFRMEYNKEFVISCGMDFEDGAQAADELMRRNIGVDAVFAFTDTLAIGCMNRLRELGKDPGRGGYCQLFRDQSVHNSTPTAYYGRTSFGGNGKKCRSVDSGKNI